MFITALVIILALTPCKAGAVEIETDPALNGTWSIGSWDTIVFNNGNFARKRTKGYFTTKDNRLILTVTQVLRDDGAVWLTKAEAIASGKSVSYADAAFRTLRGYYTLTEEGSVLDITWEDGRVFEARRK